jgi:hypothetical protein
MSIPRAPGILAILIAIPPNFAAAQVNGSVSRVLGCQSRLATLDRDGALKLLYTYRL